VAVPIRKSRNKQLREIGNQLLKQLLAERVGSRAWVLPENTRKGSSQLLCRAEDYLTVLMSSKDVVLGRWCFVEYVSVKNRHLLGVIVENNC
jgi:tRNA A37 methylthiotransferase MiaB